MAGSDLVQSDDQADRVPVSAADRARQAELARIARLASDTAARAKSQSTRRAYATAWGQYRTWCDSLQLDPLSGDPRQVALYLTAASERLAISSLEVQLAALTDRHRLADKALDVRHPILASVMAGLRRTRGTRPRRQAKPLTPALLARLVEAQPAGALGLRNRALLLVGFGAALRRSEIVSLDVGDIEFVEGKGVIITLRRSKTDQTGRGRAIAIWAAPDPALCAPTALYRWLKTSGPCSADTPLFRRIRKGDVVTADRLSDKTVVRVIQDTAERIGLSEAGVPDGFGQVADIRQSYSGHSLRAGLATAAAEAGAQIHDVMRQTGHQSADMARRYMRSAEIWENNVTAKVMRRD